MTVFTSRRGSGGMARWLLPAVIAGSFLLSWLTLVGQWVGLYNSEVGVAFLTVANVCMFAPLLWWQTRMLARADADQQRTEEALQQEAQMTSVLAKMGQELIAALNTPALLDHLCQATVEALECDRSAVVVWQPEEKVYRMAAGYGYTPEHWEMLSTLKPGSESLGSVMAQLQEREVVEVTADMPQDPASQAIFHLLGATTALCVGLWQGQDLVGYQIVAYQGGTEFTPNRRRLASGIAQLASLALTNAQLIAKLEQASRLKDAFLATISHELRTPLNSILGYTGLALENDLGPLTAEQTNALHIVKMAAETELDLITAILTVSELEAGQLRVVREAVNVTELMEELRVEMQQRLDMKPKVGLVWQVPPVLPVLHTDRTKLRLVLQNLLSNAIKFTQQGHVTVDVYPSAGGLEFCVADTGIGIAPEVRPVMFEMFRQGDSSATRRYEGAGLGLYIVRQMLELLGGAVRVESEVGRGSTFRVWAPQG